MSEPKDRLVSLERQVNCLYGVEGAHVADLGGRSSGTTIENERYNEQRARVCTKEVKGLEQGLFQVTLFSHGTMLTRDYYLTVLRKGIGGPWSK